MKSAAVVSITLLVLNLSIAGFGMAASWKDGSHSTSDGLMDFKMKIADAMSNVNHYRGDGFAANIEQKDYGTKGDAPSANSSEGNASAINSSELNSSENSPSNLDFDKNPNISLNNQSEENKTKSILPAKRSIDSGDKSISTGSTFSQNNSISPAGVYFNSQGSFGGMWSMEAGKHGFGRNGINDRIALSGNFDVQKSVAFKG